MNNNIFILLIFISLASCNIKTKDKAKLIISKKNSEQKNDTLKKRNTIKDSTFLSTIKLLKKLELPLNIEKINPFIIQNDEGYFIDTIITKNKIDDYYSMVKNNKLTALIRKKRINFFDDIASIKLKNEVYKNLNQKTIFPVWYYKKNMYIIVGSFIQFFGENDIPGVSFILTSFDTNGNMKDNITICNRFNWELLLKTDFKTISDFSKIEIVNIEEDWLLIDNSGEIIGERKKPKVKKEKKIYKLNEKGIFILNM